MVYTALLRGINVGGNNKIDMKKLKQVFEQAGMANVVTYINSGNIVFTNTDQTQTAIVHILEEAIRVAFGLQIKVLVLNMTQMLQVIDTLPETWTNDDQMKSDVLFLWEDIDDEAILDKLPYKPELETVIYTPGAVLWSIHRIHVTKCGMNKLVGTALYHRMTIRNVNTTRKIYELMLAANQQEV